MVIMITVVMISSMMMMVAVVMMTIVMLLMLLFLRLNFSAFLSGREAGRRSSISVSLSLFLSFSSPLCNKNTQTVHN